MAGLLALAPGASALPLDAARGAPDGLAQAPPDSLPDALPEDSIGVESEVDLDVTPADTAQSRVRGRRSKPVTQQHTGFDAPRWVMIRSAIIPGWGQMHNGSWLKAVGVAAGELTLVWRLREDREALDQLEREAAAAGEAGDAELEADLVDAYNTRLDDHTRRQWYLGALIAVSLLDAYIDAHFRGFKAEFEADPALPQGAAPAARIGLRFSF